MLLGANCPGFVNQDARLCERFAHKRKNTSKGPAKGGHFELDRARSFTKSGQFTTAFTIPGHFERLAVNAVLNGATELAGSQAGGAEPQSEELTPPYA